MRSSIHHHGALLAIPEIVRMVLDCFLAKPEDKVKIHKCYCHAATTFRPSILNVALTCWFLSEPALDVSCPLVGNGQSDSPVQLASWLSKWTRGRYSFISEYTWNLTYIIYTHKSIFQFPSMPLLFLTDLQVESASTAWLMRKETRLVLTHMLRSCELFKNSWSILSFATSTISLHWT